MALIEDCRHRIPEFCQTSSTLCLAGELADFVDHPLALIEDSRKMLYVLPFAAVGWLKPMDHGRVWLRQVEVMARCGLTQADRGHGRAHADRSHGKVWAASGW